MREFYPFSLKVLGYISKKTPWNSMMNRLIRLWCNYPFSLDFSSQAQPEVVEKWLHPSIHIMSHESWFMTYNYTQNIELWTLAPSGTLTQGQIQRQVYSLKIQVYFELLRKQIILIALWSMKGRINIMSHDLLPQYERA